MYWNGGSSFAQPIFDFGSSSSNYIYLTPASTAALHPLTMEIHTGTGSSVQLSTPKLSAKTWHYVAVTESSAGSIRLFVEGEPVAETTSTLSPASLGSTPISYLGKSLVSGNPLFSGRLSNVAFYTKALTAAQIAGHYDAAEHPVNVESPAITGTPRDGLSLKAKAGKWIGLTPIEFGFQWRRCNTSGESCTDIPSATAKEYAATPEDVGKTLRLMVEAGNRAGKETATSAPTATVEAAKPTNVALPAITGLFQEGATLSVNEGNWEGTPPLTFGYQWQSCNASGGLCKTITGATTSKYTLKGSEVGKTIRVSVTATNAAGHKSVNTAISSQITVAPPLNLTLPEITGTGEVDQTLEASTGAWSGTAPITYEYQWQRCQGADTGCEAIGHGGPTYKTTDEDVGRTIQVNVVATNPGFSAAATSEASAVITAPAPSNFEAPKVTGVAREGRELQASEGSWSGTRYATFSYQWEDCDILSAACMPITGAVASSYLPGPSDVGYAIRVTVTATGTDATTASSESTVTEPVAAGPYFLSQFGREDESEGDLGWPVSVAFDPANHLWVLDGANDRFTEVDSSGKPVGGWFASEGSGDGELRRPAALAIASGGEIWVADTNNNRVEKFTSEGKYVLSITATPAGNLYRPEGVAVDGAGDVWVADTGNHSLDEFGDGGEFVKTIGASTLGRPTSVAIGATGEVWVTDATSRTIDEFGESGELLAQMGSSGSGDGEFSEPYGLAVDGHGNVWAGDVGNDRVEEFNASGGYVAQFGSKGSGPGELRLESPLGLTADSAGDIWVTDTREGRIQRWHSPSTTPADETPPSVAGEAVDGQTLGVVNGTWANAPARYAYQWQRCNASGEDCEDVEGADTQSYTSVNGDLGSTVRVIVTAINSGGSTSVATSATGVIAAAVPPNNTEAPTIVGTPEVGVSLRVDAGAWSGTPPRFAYTWERCDSAGTECTPLEGATEAEYVPEDTDVGATFKVVVTGSNAAGSAEASTPVSAPVTVEATGELEAPRISGTPDADSVLYASVGAWTGTERHFSYQWESCAAAGDECTPIAGATDWEYELGAGNVGHSIRVRIGAEAAQSDLTDVSSATPTIGEAGARASTSPPSIAGVPQRGQTLTASHGDWAGNGAETATYAYQWQRCDQLGYDCHDIEAATGATYEPTAADANSALRVEVSVSAEEHTSSRDSSATQPIAGVGSPTAERAPQIRGTALRGHTLTASVGTWGGETPSGYAYQWERCTETGCEAIEGATDSSYTPVEADVGSTLVALVDATNAAGTSTAVSMPTASIASPSLTTYSQPTIAGVIEVGGTLGAEPGIWSGEGPITYAYQWESCNAGGAECEPIGEATESTYEMTSGNLGSALRVKVTVTGPSGSEVERSAATLAVPNGDVSAEAAEEVAEHTDPAVLAPSTTATLEAQTIAPSLADGEQIAPEHTLTSSAVSKELAGELSVNTPDGELSVTPVESSPQASPVPTIVNGAAALYANTSPATDTIVRADALGASTILQLRSAEAPKAFSWEIGLGADQHLRQLSDGSVAVIDTPQAPEAAVEPAEPDAHESGEGEPETPEEKTQLEHEEEVANSESEPVFETPPASPTSSTLPTELPTEGLRPQDTLARYERDSEAMSIAEAQAGDATQMVIIPPQVQDGEGHTVPASLSMHGDTVTMTLDTNETTAYPVLANLSIGAPSDKTSSERDPFEYGLSDEEPSHFGDGLDPRLKSGALNIKTARLFVAYDALVPAEERKEASRERKRIEEWLSGVEKNGLTPYVVFQHSAHRGKSLSEYRAGITLLMKKFKGRVKYWGAWNEPDLSENAVLPGRAAEYWQTAQAVAKHVGCHCTVVAGELSEYSLENINKKKYGAEYRKALETYCAKCWKDKREWKKNRKPQIIGLHDYRDVVEFGDHSLHLKQFEQYAKGGVYGRAPRIWIGEAGVQLNNGEGKTALFSNSEPLSFAVQTAAAEAFLDLHSALIPGEKVSRVERIYYYHYQAPREVTVMEREEEKGKQTFDSGLIEAKPENKGESRGDVRPAYCVIAYSSHKCPPEVLKTEPEFRKVGPPEHEYDELYVVPLINPHGLATTVEVRLGGGGVFTTQIAPGVIHPIRAPVQIGPVGPCDLYSYHAVAKNEGGETSGKTLEEGEHCE
jgi:sugar lactone lactonase YvrE